MTVWLCRAGLRGEYENKFIDLNKVFLIGSVGIDLTGKTEMEDLMRTISRLHPTEPDGSVTTMSVQARAFATKAKVGDWVVLPSMGDEKLLNIGEITNGYRYDGTKSELKHTHEVDWKYGAWTRDSFDEDIIRSVDAFDSFMMFYKLRQEKRIKEIVSAGEPFADVKAVPKKSINKPEAEPIEESEPVFENSEITEVIAEIRDTITQVRKSNISEIAEVKKMIAEVMDVIEEVRATITEVKKATLTEAAEVKKVIAEVRDSLEGSEGCCCGHDHVHDHVHEHDHVHSHGVDCCSEYDEYDLCDDGEDFTYRLSFFDSLRARRRFRR
jgi:predicted Mrr-cat superfamily restriction endonuclease